jgi:hypothetical protein
MSCICVQEFKPCPTSSFFPVTQLMKLDFPTPVCPTTAIKTSFLAGSLAGVSSEELCDEASRSSGPSLEGLKAAAGSILAADTTLIVEVAVSAGGGNGLVGIVDVLVVEVAVSAAGGNGLVGIVDVLDVEGAFLVNAVSVIADGAFFSAVETPVGSLEETAASSFAFSFFSSFASSLAASFALSLASSFASLGASEGKVWACDSDPSLDVIVSVSQSTDENRHEQIGCCSRTEK